MAKKRKSETPTGYRRVCDNMMAVAARIRKGLKELKREDGTPYVQLLDAGDTKCLPVVAPGVHGSARWCDIITRRSRRASTRP